MCLDMSESHTDTQVSSSDLCASTLACCFRSIVAVLLLLQLPLPFLSQLAAAAAPARVSCCARLL